MKTSKSVVIFAFICISPFICDARATEPCLKENEVFDVCRGHCDPTCFDPEPICYLICTGGCVCAPGLLRNEAGDCVSVDKCPTNGTDVALLTKYSDPFNSFNKELCQKENEVYDECTAHCDATCSDPQPLCTRDCNKGCICAHGLLRNQAGDCVTQDQCRTEASARSVRSAQAITAILLEF